MSDSQRTFTTNALIMKTLLAVVLFLLIAGGCSKKIVKKDTNTLVVRLKKYAHALTVNDFDAAYSYESKENRNKKSYEKYLEEKWSSNAESEIYKVTSIKYDKVKDEYLVKIKAILVNLPEIKNLSLADIRGERWKFIDGDWYRLGPEKKTLSSTALNAQTGPGF